MKDTALLWSVRHSSRDGLNLEHPGAPELVRIKMPRQRAGHLDAEASFELIQIIFTGIGAFVFLYWLFKDSEVGGNKWGENPKGQ